MRYGVFVLAAVLAAPAFAGSGGGQNMAGCGWGSQVFKENQNTKGAQSTAATSNGLFFNQAFGITSGTSGCSASSGFSSVQREQFLSVNRRTLTRELAAGQGEYATSFASLMGCRGDGVSAFLAYAKRNHAAIFAVDSATPASILKSLEAGIADDEKLSGSCSI